MPAATTTNLANILKKVWPRDELEKMFFTNHPLFAMLPKDTSWAGDVRAIQVQYGVTAGRSSTFANAKANKNPSLVARMNVETADNFCVWSIDHKLITLSRNDKGAIVRALEFETKNAMEKFKRSTGMMVFGNGGGSIGRLRSDVTLAGTTFTLNTTRDARKFEVNDVLKLASTDGTSGSVRAGSLTVTAVNRKTGVVTVDQNISTGVPTAAASDYIFIEGDFGNWVKGVDFYVPSSDPSTTAWGMTRTADPIRLGGLRVGGKNMLIEEAIKKALTEAYYEEAEISHIMMNPSDFNSLDLSLGSQRRYADEKVGSVGFTGLQFVSGTMSGPVKCFQDPDCPQNVIYGLTMDTWTFASAGDYPDWLNMNGNRYEQEESSNSFEGRIGGYAQMYTTAPGKTFRLDLTAT